MDPKFRNLLDHLGESRDVPQLILRTGISRASIYRYVERLVADGLVSKSGENYRITDAGRILLADPSRERSRPLQKLWPWLSLFPTALHRAMATLILFALAARRVNAVDDSHPGFVLIGKTQQMKSWLCKVICHLAGSESTRSVNSRMALSIG